MSAIKYASLAVMVNAHLLGLDAANLTSSITRAHIISVRVEAITPSCIIVTECDVISFPPVTPDNLIASFSMLALPT
jgi:hypothetical protein